jgi:hypothetical protein
MIRAQTISGKIIKKYEIIYFWHLTLKTWIITCNEPAFGILVLVTTQILSDIDVLSGSKTFGKLRCWTGYETKRLALKGQSYTKVCEIMTWYSSSGLN